MVPMSIAETPILAREGIQPSVVDGVHLVARRYKKGTRLGTHMHREAQLVYAAGGTMQVTTPKGRWLVPPDRAVWVPARLEHSIDVLADTRCISTLNGWRDGSKATASMPNMWCGCRGCCMRR